MLILINKFKKKKLITYKYYKYNIIYYNFYDKFIKLFSIRNNIKNKHIDLCFEYVYKNNLIYKIKDFRIFGYKCDVFDIVKYKLHTADFKLHFNNKILYLI